MSQQTVPKRSEVKLEETWDLSPIFKTDEDFEAALEAAKVLPEEVQKYRGRLTQDPQTLYEFFQFSEKTQKTLMALHLYAHLQNDVETSNSTYSGRYSRARQFFAQVSAAMSFIEPELATLDAKTLDAWYKEVPELELYRHQFELKLRNKPHILSDVEEKILAELSPVISAPAQTFSQLTDADLTFEKVKDSEGNEHEVSEGRYRVYLEKEDRELRKNYLSSLMGAYHAHRNCLASTLSSQMNADNIGASIRHFKTAREEALHYTQIPVSVYDQLIETVRKNISVLHDYTDYRKERLGLEELHYYDMMIPLDDDKPEQKFSFEEAKEIVLEALKPLGEAYRQKLLRAFDERWIDIPENKGKRTGAYSSGAYGYPAYILLNWNGSLDAIYTLIHELGHSMHSVHTWENQPYVYAHYGIFLAEIASTTNENLLTAYLLEKYKDDVKMQRYLLTNYLDGIKGTVFRQTMFAEFELLIHEALQGGTALTADYLDQNYGRLTSEYFGQSLTMDPEVSYEWARIPHFYYNYYVYQYATGFSAATLFADKILHGNSEDVERYIAYLSAGASDYPIEVLKKAGVDMTKPEATEITLKRFAETLARLKELDQKA